MRANCNGSRRCRLRPGCDTSANGRLVGALLFFTVELALLFSPVDEVGCGGWVTLDDDDDSVSAQAKLRERIWQLESDVSALLLVDARRRLADRRQTLIDSNKGKAIAPHQKYAKPQRDSLSKRHLLEVGKRCVCNSTSV